MNRTHEDQLPEVWFIAAVTRETPGGVLHNTQALARGLQELGYLVRTLFAHKNENAFAFGIRALATFLRSRRPDIIIARSFDGYACAAFIRLLRLSTKVIVQSHGWEERSYHVEKTVRSSTGLPPRTTLFALLVRFPLLRLCLRLSHACLCGTVNEIRWAKVRYPYQRSLFLVPNGTEAPKSKWGQSHPPLLFLTIGPHTWKKNLAYAFDVVSTLRKREPSARLTMVGCGSQAPSLPLFTEAIAQGWLTMIPSDPFEAMRAHYALHPFLIAPSMYEGGHPLSVLEALSHGCLVFASAIPSHQEIIRPSCNGFFLSGNLELDAKRIIAVAADPASCAIRANAVASALRHRWARQISRLERVISDL